MIKAFRLVIILLTFSVVSAQNKKPIDTDAYYKWKTLSDEQITDKGNWVSYIEKSYRGNDNLILLENGEPWKSWVRVNRYHVDPEEHFVVFQQKLDYDTIRQLKIDKVKKKKWPKDSLGIYLANADTTYWHNKVENFQTGEEGAFVLITHDESFKLPKEEPEKEKKKCFHFSKKKKGPKEIKNGESLGGTVLTIFNTNNPNESYQVEHVSASSVCNQGTQFGYVTSHFEDTVVIQTLYAGSSSGGAKLFDTEGEITNLTWSEDGGHLAFNLTTDTTEAKVQQLMLLDYKSGNVGKLLDTVSDHLANYRSVWDKPMKFSKDGSKLYFQVGVKPVNEPKDTIPDDEKAKLDVWSWTDGKIQPQQLKSAKKDVLGLIDYVYHIDDDKVVQLQDSSAQSLKYYQNRDGRFALLSDQTPYLHEMTWDFWYYDVYRVDLETGEKMKLKEHVYGWEYDLSPSGEYFTYWNASDSSWYLQIIATGAELNLTKDIDDDFYDRHHDVPSQVGASGNVFWLVDENACAIESQNNFWIIPLNGKPYKFTKGEEKDESYTLQRFDDEEFYIDLTKGFYLKSFNHRTKAEGLYYYGVNGLEKLAEWDAKLMTMKQSKESKKIIFEKMSFTESYNLFLADDMLGKQKQISDINPQQDSYNWATVELVNWKDYNGDSVNGLLYKPEDFDPTKAYPMIVYYYELYTDDIHIYYRPKPTASIIYPTEYASNGYIVFIPDIKYEIGHPAKSAYNVIMSGTDAVLEKYPNIDSTRMGLQGQSWGGYQTAQMVTMTTRYKCAMAGAPVSNMFSAYGGVRWGSGLSRTFQYETGQSRIGATIWEEPELYVENSPLFHLPKVETPLLIMHNDGDGAVPWYQGIELYQGLRRLQKPVWMFNYNDDEHNLMKDANRMDLSIRMREFFDHYLLDVPAPKWMLNGVPAVKKGKE